ncbi:MAG: hypothetical protein C4K49_03490 [Candidatus Thorarchaeota archaeon]|nr:MAG: hypothetical protein C4K49_03490 [Candidatus Thorarchaeota archaeon]
MSKRPRKEKVSSETDLESFELDPSELNLKWSRNLITVFDAYRIHRCYDLTFIERAVGKGDVPRTFIRQWPTVRLVLHKFASVGPDLPGVQMYMVRRQRIQFTFLVLLTFALPLVIIPWVFRIPNLEWFTTPFLLVTVAALLVSVFAQGWYNRKVSWVIFYYIENNPDLLAKEREYLKKWVQLLIWHTSRLIRKSELKPEKQLVKFYNDDYDGIIVLKEPKGLRKHYEIKLDTGRA